MGICPVVARARIFVDDVIDRCAQAVASGGARCSSQVFNRGA
jgi:hypothetical protein